MQPQASKSQLPKLVELIQNDQSGVICLPPQPTQDAVAAATALYMGLSHIDKNVSLVCAQPVKSSLHASDKINTEFATPGDSLVVSFPYEEGGVDKVDYYIENDRFNVVITPRPGHEKLDEKKVAYSYTGGTIDFAITIDTPSLKTLGELHEKNQEQFKNKKILNIDRHLTNTFYGAANLVNRNISSESELVLQLLEALNVEISKEIATNLLTGIIASTANYQAPHTNAGSFETSAKLMKMGAVKPKIVQAAPSATNRQVPSGMNAQGYRAPVQQMQAGYPSQQAPFQRPAGSIPQGSSAAPQPIQRTAPPQRQMPPVQQPQPNPAPSAPPADDADDDWLKPQIFNNQPSPSSKEE